MAEEACTAQVVVASQSHSEGEGAEDDVIHLDPADSFSVPEQAVTTPSTLDRAEGRKQLDPQFQRLCLPWLVTLCKPLCCLRN